MEGALGTSAETLMAASDANVFKGLTDATMASGTYAYLSNFRAGTVDVLKGSAADPNPSGAQLSTANTVTSKFGTPADC
jgi:hypothetical protein